MLRHVPCHPHLNRDKGGLICRRPMFLYLWDPIRTTDLKLCLYRPYHSLEDEPRSTSAIRHSQHASFLSKAPIRFQTADYPRPTNALQRLIRFLAKDNRIYYSDAILPNSKANITKTKKARIIISDIFGKHDMSDRVFDIRLLLAPLALEDVRTVRCIGMNYTKHSIEVRDRRDQVLDAWANTVT